MAPTKHMVFHRKCAKELVAKDAILCFENLNIAAMQRLWGRKINDLGFAAFLKILQYEAQKDDSGSGYFIFIIPPIWLSPFRSFLGSLK